MPTATMSHRLPFLFLLPFLLRTVCPGFMTFRRPGLNCLPVAASDLAWVQSNRLAVVEERSPGVTVVHLDRAHEPAPSRAALGWLETSVRSYAKYVDVVARTLRDEADEAETVRRERMAITEIRDLLSEMTAHAAS